MTSPSSLFSIGGGLFNLITTGMYDTPLAIYREYIQNARDAIWSLGSESNARVQITIDPLNRSVSINDNGPGLSHEAVERNLIAVAQSSKRRGTDIGFRGIGRLSGLAFADSIVFRTRSSSMQTVVQLVWDGLRLRQLATQNSLTPSEVIQQCVTISELDGSDWPDHFFEVEIRNVARYAAGEILNEERVRSYIAEVCPVPLNVDFPYSNAVNRMFEEARVPFACLDIRLNTNGKTIKRPFGGVLEFGSGERADTFVEFESFSVPPVDGSVPAALGWLAHTEYSGALPKSLSVRGLRVREGNLQIGCEQALDHLFPEERFNRWCVGEVHVTDPRILPNARRDYFEPGPHTRNLENHLESIARNISERCRSASTGRNRIRKLVAEIDQTEIIYELATSGYLKAPDSRLLVETALKRIREVLIKTSDINAWASIEQGKLEDLENRLMSFRPKRGRPALGRIQTSEIGTYQKIFCALTETSPTPKIAKETIERVLALV